jgi:putative flippase GtrA
MVVLIPAYEPDRRLVELCAELRRLELSMVVVDDGSGPGFAEVFGAVASLGCDVITLTCNQGKGHALKQGFAHAERTFPGEDVVTADCDGQHTIADILRVGAETAARRDSIVLGTRRFSGAVPLRSRLGNGVTRMVFARSTGRNVGDTQTGLRGYPAGSLAWLQHVPGERFEYELSVLLQAADGGCVLREVPIDTVYLDDNASSHFRPIVDSLRVYLPLVRFSLSSLAAFLLDFVLVLVLYAATGSLAASVVVARVVSATLNYTANRTYVFASGASTSVITSAARYFGLAGILLAANYGLMHLLHEEVGAGIVVAKLVTEAAMFLGSYQVQRRFVFATGHSHPALATGIERRVPARGQTAAAGGTAAAAPPVD